MLAAIAPSRMVLIYALVFFESFVVLAMVIPPTVVMDNCRVINTELGRMSSKQIKKCIGRKNVGYLTVTA